MKKPYNVLSRGDLKNMIDEGRKMSLIEVLPEESYRDFHLPGAINIPGDRLRKTIPTVVPDTRSPVVVYCANPSCTASDRAARLLSSMGYRNVFDYRGGKEHWKEGGLPVVRAKLEPAAI